MSQQRYSRLYRSLTQSIVNRFVHPEVLGSTEALTQLDPHAKHQQICYVLQDASLSNTVLIDQQAQQRGLPSVFEKFKLTEHQEKDRVLALNDQNQQDENYHYSAKLVRLIEQLQQQPEMDVLLVPVSVLWGRSPEYENSWLKALFADAWATPSKIKQAMNVSLYSHDSYIEFHSALSLRALMQKAQTEAPHYAPAHFVVQHLRQEFNKYKEAILGPDLSDRRNLINKLMKTEVIQQAIVKESIEHKISMFEAENRAKGYLTEVVSDFSYATLRFLELALTKLWTQLYDGIDDHHFDTVRELAKDYQLVYTPCHRSHIDYLLLSFLIFNRGLMVPHIAAGINLNLPVVGQILRGGGAYFIRRSFSGNPLYTTVFKEYLHSLLMRNTPLEYFIEGGRSRTGFLLPPKKGMLSMTIQSHLRSPSNKPIAFIPTYFGYEKLMEGSSYINELSGKPKQSESLWGLLGSMRKIEKIFGRVHVNFGEPVLLDDMLNKHQAQDIRLGLKDELPEAVLNVVDDTATSILQHINNAAVINPIALMSLILLHTPAHALAEHELLAHIKDYQNLLRDSQYDARMVMTELSPEEIIAYALKLKQVQRQQQDGVNIIAVQTHQHVLLSYFNHNILHSMILPAWIARVLTQQQSLTLHELKQHLTAFYPFLKQVLFLKWADINAVSDYLARILNSFCTLGWVNVQQERFTVNVVTEHLPQWQSLCQISDKHLNLYLLILYVLQQYSKENVLDASALEKLSQASLKRLQQQTDTPHIAHFDRAIQKSVLTVLQQMGLISVDHHIQIQNIEAFHVLIQQFESAATEALQQCRVLTAHEVEQLLKK